MGAEVLLRRYLQLAVETRYCMPEGWGKEHPSIELTLSQSVPRYLQTYYSWETVCREQSFVQDPAGKPGDF
jgi:hypothetical protein